MNELIAEFERTRDEMLTPDGLDLVAEDSDFLDWILDDWFPRLQESVK
jgi:hypothetical protein